MFSRVLIDFSAKNGLWGRYFWKMATFCFETEIPRNFVLRPTGQAESASGSAPARLYRPAIPLRNARKSSSSSPVSTRITSQQYRMW